MHFLSPLRFIDHGLDASLRLRKPFVLFPPGLCFSRSIRTPTRRSPFPCLSGGFSPETLTTAHVFSFSTFVFSYRIGARPKGPELPNFFRSMISRSGKQYSGQNRPDPTKRGPVVGSKGGTEFIVGKRDLCLLGRTGSKDRGHGCRHAPPIPFPGRGGGFPFFLGLFLLPCFNIEVMTTGRPPWRSVGLPSPPHILGVHSHMFAPPIDPLKSFFRAPVWC